MPNVENHVDEGGDKSEVVVTEAMIEVAVEALDDPYLGKTYRALVLI